MNQAERDRLMDLQTANPFALITASDLSCQENRTLLDQGSLFVDRHVYLLDGCIYVADIQHDAILRIIATTNSDYVYQRNSRVQFECSDYEFCKLLIERGCNLNFVAGAPLPNTHYQLPIWPEHARLPGCPSSPWVNRTS
jgi:hypothetical protein